MTSIRVLIGYAWATALIGCHEPAPPPAAEVAGTTKFDVLAPYEQVQYMTDQQYIHRLVRPGKSVGLNLADPVQHRFAMARLKLAGKTPLNSPHLFELIEARRADHVARELKAGTFIRPGAQTHALVGGTAEIQNMHYLEAAMVGKEGGVPAVKGTAASTFIGGAYYTYVDTFITTTAGYPISNYEYIEQFEPPPDANLGANVVISAEGDPLSSPHRRFSVTTYKMEDSAEGFLDDYVYEDIGSTNVLSTAAIPELAVPIIGAPLDVIANGNISVCIDRSWTNDCDYIVPGIGAQSVRMPLAGSVSLTSSHVFDSDLIDDIRTALQNGWDPPIDPGYVKLVLANAGGGCDVTDGNTLTSQMRMFWDTVTLSEGNRKFSWNLTGAAAAYFDSGCRQVQDRAKLTARIALPMREVPSNEPYLSSITVTSDPDVVRPEALLTQITLTNSCLAEGTQIRLGNGRHAAIEALRIGQQVFNPHDRKDRALTITDTAKGVEHAPMVRIRDAAGRTLLMTEMHPIVVVDRGMVQARALRAGDRVMTEQGPSELVEVTREPYSGQVYNLKLGSEAELASLGDDQTIVYANGFVVGDGQIQTKYEALAAKRDRRSEIAAQWRIDALMSESRR